MLTENSWTERGLVNGVLGTVRGFSWLEGADVDKDIPTVLVEFNSYDGPLLEEFEGHRVVLIVASRREFAINNVACTRTQLPLTVA
jgi:hypothetical protein